MCEKPTLYIIATPIGNLEDISLRAIRILKENISAIYCEDTRQSKKLLQAYSIKHPLYALHSHSNQKIIDNAVNILKTGKNIAYLTDCGTPAISDPGSRLVNAIRKNNLNVSPLPGSSALTALVSVSGFPGKNITFGGFLSKKEGKKSKELIKLKEFKGIIVIYESPHRIIKTLNTIFSIFENNEILIGREMTKIYEEFILLNSSSDIEKLANITIKGEFSIAINNN